MKLVYSIALLLLAAGLWTCTTENPIILPEVPGLSGVAPVPDNGKPIMEGVYTVSTGGELFGERIVVKWHGKKLTIFSANNYLVVEHVGQMSSDILMRGYWRVPTSDASGLADLEIKAADGAGDILNGVTPSSIVIRGKYGNGDHTPENLFEFTYQRAFSSTVTSKPFYIVAHRAGGRTSDRLPVSENSIEMIKYTANYGSNGVEIDIRLTKDLVPVLYHDGDLNIRLTTKGPLNGDINNFTWDQLNTFVRLIRGERIPKLADALTYVVDSTELSFVWLDMKDTSPDLVKYVEPIQQAAIDRAISKGRQLKILMGVPTQEVFDALRATPNYQAIPSLCEISPEGAAELNSEAWAPRWTLGTQNEVVANVQNQGRIVLCWTIDVPAYIREFISNGRFDGLLSNYPSYIAYYHYIRE